MNKVAIKNRPGAEITSKIWNILIEVTEVLTVMI
jgi:hypothetical protein